MLVGMSGSRPPAASAYHPAFEIASGGMGRVDLVVRREGRFARAYAMKRLHGIYEDDPGIRASFLDEARIAGLVRDIHVVSVLDVGTDAGGAWLVMDYVEGLSLAQVLVRFAREGSKLPVPLCIDVARQAALGLHAAHQVSGSGGRSLGVIHRDVSPQNILLGFDGIVRVTDFGVARAVDATVKTRSGVLKGKIGYMAPEQLRIERLDQRTDLYALGVVLFEMLAGRRLRSSDPNEAREQILHGAPPDIEEHRPDLPPELVELLFELMAPNPAMRPDAITVARRLAEIARTLDEDDAVDLTTFLADRFAAERAAQKAGLAAALAEGTEHTGVESPIHEAPTRALAPAPLRPRRRRWPLAAAALVLLLTLALFAVASSGPGPEEANAPENPDPPAETVASGPGPNATTAPPAGEAAHEPEPATEAAPEPDRAHRTKRRRARRRALEAAPAGEMPPTPSVPSWDWN